MSRPVVDAARKHPVQEFTLGPVDEAEGVGGQEHAGLQVAVALALVEQPGGVLLGVGPLAS